MARKIQKQFIGYARQLNVDENRLKYFKGIQWKRPKYGSAALVYFRQKPDTFLRINPKVWKGLNPEQRLGLLKHEAVHYKSHRHDFIFKMYAEKINAPLSFLQGTYGKAILQGQKIKGERFTNLKEFDTFENAQKYIRENKNNFNQFKKIRVIY